MNDSLKITYIGGPTVLLEFGGVRILTDPTFDPAGGEYTSGPVTLHKIAGPAIQPGQLGAINHVLLSHDHHSDNLDRAGREILKGVDKVLTTSEGAQRLGGNSVGMDPWGFHDLTVESGRTMRVVATPARHGPAGLERGAVIGFLLFMTDFPEQSIYISGDTVWYEGVAEVARRHPVQVALLHIGSAQVPEVGPYHLTMTSDEAVEAAKNFSHATVVPVHYEGWAHFSEGRADVIEAFRKAKLESRLLWLTAGRPTEIQLAHPLKRAI